MVVAKAKPHHAQKPYILEITKNAPVPGAFFVFHERYKGIRNSPPQCRVCPAPVEPRLRTRLSLSARSASQSYRLFLIPKLHYSLK